jgi:hypothetical protein
MRTRPVAAMIPISNDDGPGTADEAMVMVAFIGATFDRGFQAREPSANTMSPMIRGSLNGRLALRIT